MCVSSATDFPLEPPTAAHWRKKRLSMTQDWLVHSPPSPWRTLRYGGYGDTPRRCFAGGCCFCRWLLYRRDLHIPRAAPPSRVAREDEPLEWFLAVKGAINVPVSSSCTSRNKGTRVGHWEPVRATPRNQSFNLEGSGHGGGFHSSPTLSAAWASIATISGSKSDTVDRPEGGNVTESSFPEWSDSPSKAGLDIRLSGGAPKDKSETPREGPTCSLCSSTGSEVPVAGRALDGGEFLTVTVRPARLLPEVAPHPPSPVTTRGTLYLHRGIGTLSLCRKRSLVCSSVTVIFPQWEHDSSTKATSACLMPRHKRQQSWPSPGAR